MRLILLGPPGAGKGTQADLIKKTLGVPKLSTGDMLRETAASGTEFGNELQAIMNTGAFVSDEIMIEMIRQRINQDDCKNGFILDGFPRNTEQAKALDELFIRENLALDLVLELKVEEEALIERISGRFTCANCGAGYHDRFKPTSEKGVCDVCGSTEFTRRADDNAETVANRLKIYHEMTAPLLPYYQQRGVLRRVDAMQPIADVTKEIENLLK
jgi:adenylate kinase